MNLRLSLRCIAAQNNIGPKKTLANRIRMVGYPPDHERLEAIDFK